MKLIVSLEEAVGETEEVIVTGVFDQRSRMTSSVAISTINSKLIGQLAPTSAADLLRNVPGVYVNNARGEIANTVYSRGISANSIDNASGYYYVSMQEDGLPVSNVAWQRPFHQGRYYHGPARGCAWRNGVDIWR